MTTTMKMSPMTMIHKSGWRSDYGIAWARQAQLDLRVRREEHNMAKRTQNFIEQTYQTGRPTIDRDAGVIRGVKILGASSKNGRDYSPQALREAAAIYEGLGVNTNHPNRATPNVSRTVEEGVGWLENVTVKPDGVYGDLNIIKSHPLAETLFEVAERKPDRFGLSHNAAGDVVERNGRRIVESIKSVRSVDLVQNPATVHSLFESEVPVARRRLKDLVQQLPAGSRRSRLARLLEADDMPFDSDTEVAPEAGGDEGDPYDTALETMVLEVLRNADLSDDEKIAQITQIIKGEADPDAEATGEDTGDEEAPVTESVLRKRLAAAEHELLEVKSDREARRLLEGARLEVTEKRVKLLKAVQPATRQDLIEEWSALPKKSVQRPFRSPPVPLLEGVTGGSMKPAKGADAMLAAYR